MLGMRLGFTQASPPSVKELEMHTSPDWRFNSAWTIAQQNETLTKRGYQEWLLVKKCDALNIWTMNKIDIVVSPNTDASCLQTTVVMTGGIRMTNYEKSVMVMPYEWGDTWTQRLEESNDKWTVTWTVNARCLSVIVRFRSSYAK